MLVLLLFIICSLN